MLPCLEVEGSHHTIPGDVYGIWHSHSEETMGDTLGNSGSPQFPLSVAPAGSAWSPYNLIEKGAAGIKTLQNV